MDNSTVLLQDNAETDNHSQAQVAINGAQFQIDCSPDLEVEQILQQFADRESRCKVRTLATARAMIEAGAAKSEREAAKLIAEQSGENPDTVRKRMLRGKKAVETGVSTIQDEALDPIVEFNEDVSDDDKLVRLKKPSPIMALKMMSKLKLCKQLNELVKELMDNGAKLDSVRSDSPEVLFGVITGLVMVIKNINRATAESEVYVAINDYKAVEAVKAGRAPWEV